jgi:cell wall assembly regulator SMI1
MSGMISEAYDELFAMLESISPHYQQIFLPPATEIELCSLEKTCEISLPGDFRQFLKRHNGCRGDKLFVAFSLLSTDGIASKTLGIREEFKESERPFTEGGWDRQKLIIGDSLVGWTLVIDCPSGALYVYAQHNYAVPLAGSFVSYLVGLKDNLRDGKYRVVKNEIFMEEWGQRFC